MNPTALRATAFQTSGGPKSPQTAARPASAASAVIGRFEANTASALAGSAFPGWTCGPGPSWKRIVLGRGVVGHQGAPQEGAKRSTLPSASKSAAASDSGVDTVNGANAARLKPPPAWPRKTETRSLSGLAVARSGLPSPLTSATITEAGPEPTSKIHCPRKEPSPLPRSTLTELLS